MRRLSSVMTVFHQTVAVASLGAFGLVGLVALLAALRRGPSFGGLLVGVLVLFGVAAAWLFLRTTVLSLRHVFADARGLYVAHRGRREFVPFAQVLSVQASFVLQFRFVDLTLSSASPLAPRVRFLGGSTLFGGEDDVRWLRARIAEGRRA